MIVRRAIAIARSDACGQKVFQEQPPHIKVAHAKSLVDVIMTGDFGKTSMTRPSLLIGQDGKPLTSSDDGLIVIDNGKAWVHALKQCEAKYTELESELSAACPQAEAITAIPEDQWPEWVLPALRRTFQEGLLMDFMQFPTDDRFAHAAMQTLMHEADQNKYRPSTVCDKVSMVRRAHTGDWMATKRQLLELLGQQKMSAIQRWITLARDVDQQVLDWVDNNWGDLPQSYIVGNKFLTGKGEDWRLRLSKQYGVLALSILKEDIGSLFDFMCGRSSPWHPLGRLVPQPPLARPLFTPTIKTSIPRPLCINPI